MQSCYDLQGLVVRSLLPCTVVYTPGAPDGPLFTPSFPPPCLRPFLRHSANAAQKSPEPAPAKRKATPDVRLTGFKIVGEINQGRHSRRRASSGATTIIIPAQKHMGLLFVLTPPRGLIMFN